MSFPFPINVSIPATNDDPAADQPIMMQNYANIAGYLAVDHVPAGTNPGAAFHKEITYYKKNPTDYVPVVAPTDPTSISFTAQASNLTSANPVGSGSNVMQQFYRNANGIFPGSAIRAFAHFVTPAADGAVIPTNAFNVTSIMKVSGVYTITLVTNSVIGSNYVFIPTAFNPANSSFAVLKYSVAANVITLNLATPQNILVDFLVLQI